MKRIVISKSNQTSEQCVSDAYSKLSPNVLVIYSQHDVVFGNDRYSTDITREVLTEVKKAIEPQQIEGLESKKNVKNKESETNTIFLGYSYRQIDDEFVTGFKELLEDKGYEVIDGKADGLGSISKAIIDKISLADIVVIVMTKRDKKVNEKYTTAAWLLEEKGAALAFGKKVGMFVEEEIDDSDIGGMQGDNQRFHFTRNNFLKVAMNFLKILEKEY
ncbi:MAG: hypothetical protein RID18_01210 [Cytophagales bacterium]